MTDLLASVLGPLTDPASIFFWVYLVVAAVMGFACLAWRSQSAGLARLKDAGARLLDRRVLLHPSALLDYRFVAVNAALFALVLGTLVVSAGAVSLLVSDALDALFGPGDAVPGLGAGVAYTACMFLLYDLSFFLGHWLQHRIPFLWEFHKVHHSAEVLTPVTAIRSHPVSEIVGGQISAAILGLANGAFLHLYGGKVAELTLYGVNGLLFLHYSVGALHLSHSHVWMMFPRYLREVFLSPAMHIVHHSADPKHFGRNYAMVLTIWDRLAGTLYMPDDSERDRITVGLGPEDKGKYDTVWQLYTTPFKEVLKDERGPGDPAEPRDQHAAEITPPAG